MSDPCRREGIKPHSYYLWTKEFMEAGKERLARETVRDATQQEVQALRRENLELKQLVAELSLEGHMRRLEGHWGGILVFSSGLMVLFHFRPSTGGFRCALPEGWMWGGIPWGRIISDSTRWKSV